MSVWVVQIKNFKTDKYENMKLKYDPRTGTNGDAIYKTKDEAVRVMEIANAMAGRYIKVRVVEF